VQRHDVQRSVDGGAWTAVTSYGALTAQIYQLAGGHTYRFRVRAWDWAGWSAGWTRPAWANASGGYIKLTGTRGASGRLAFRGRSLALYGPRAASLGLSAIYLDGRSRRDRQPVVVDHNGAAAALPPQRPQPRDGARARGSLARDRRHEGGGTRVAVDVASIVR
jgi:hypothetical protein